MTDDSNPVWQIAQRDYNFGRGKHRSLTKATYDAIGDHFRGLWGKEAGWAHSVLFAADLRTFAAKETVKPETDEIKSDENTDPWGPVKPVVDGFMTKRKIEEHEHIYIKSEPLSETGVPVVPVTDDVALHITEQLSMARKAKRRRAK